MANPTTEQVTRCTLCPRRCGAVRTETAGGGVCRMPTIPRVARAALHHWEEPVISGTRGSGAIFFSGCALGCVYCQNRTISAEGFGAPVDAPRLRQIMEDLIARGAHNINLVTASHFAPQVVRALDAPLTVPVVWNCGGYESPEILALLEGKVQVYLPDLKYADDALAAALSGAPDYFAVATAAITEMYRQVGSAVVENGLLVRGVLIRHLMLPGQLDNTRRVIDWVAATFPPGAVLFSLMRQYTPQPDAAGFLSRAVRGSEYRAAAAYLENCGIESGFLQDAEAAASRYTPPFDLTGL